MYCVSKTQISKTKQPDLHAYLLHYCELSKNLYNASLYRIRQNYTMQGKDKLTENESEVLQEICKAVEASSFSMPGYSMSYEFLEKLMRVNHNPDFFAGLPMQSAQATVRSACKDFKTWLASMKAYDKNPASFMGKPNMPGYKKSSIAMVKFTNQDCVLKESVLKFPKTKITLSLPHLLDNAKIKEVQIQPYYNDLMVIVIYEVVNQPNTIKDMLYVCGIDFGVSNLAAIVSNDGSSLLYKGGVIKSANQWFNKQKAKYISALDKENKPRDTKMLQSLSKNRENFINDYFHKVSSDIVRYCIEHNIGTIVMGKNEGWKQHSNIGRENNQTFVSIPFNKLQKMIAYKAERAGITVIEQEESYTSKASFLDRDDIPVYQKGCDVKYTFSGVRKPRGLYHSADKTVLNSDLNGAANILRKAIPTAFDDVTDYAFLNQPTVKNCKNINSYKNKN